jgi:N-acetyl-alpha-D-muramate 1-phosphate uridylyltransferase
MTTIPTHAMVLAAGLGLRMRPLTLTTPKPLLAVAGRTMLDRVLDHLDEVGVAHRVVNAHWLAASLHQHLAGRPGVSLSDEPEVLETGGGVAKALPLLGDRPFYVCNADIVWEDGRCSALRRLAEAWDGERMDALLLMQPTATAFGYDGPGDFFLDDHGRARRRSGDEVSPLLFAGVQILHPRLFDGAPAGKFSLNVLFDKAAAAGRLYGLVHDGAWYHIGTPEALGDAEKLLAARASTSLRGPRAERCGAKQSSQPATPWIASPSARNDD